MLQRLQFQQKILVLLELLLKTAVGTWQLLMDFFLQDFSSWVLMNSFALSSVSETSERILKRSDTHSDNSRKLCPQSHPNNGVGG